MGEHLEEIMTSGPLGYLMECTCNPLQAQNTTHHQDPGNRHSVSEACEFLTKRPNEQFGKSWLAGPPRTPPEQVAQFSVQSRHKSRPWSVLLFALVPGPVCCWILGGLLVEFEPERIHARSDVKQSDGKQSAEAPRKFYPDCNLQQ